jgi:flagellar L-ring protein precursor FlgH
VDVDGKSDYKGEGSGERKDRFTARISALVIDVKPNGTLVVEARETQQFDDDIKTLVVSGICDPKDVTIQGTVLSSQVANLVIRVEHQGQVKDSATKGWIPRVFDAIFGL